MGIVLSNAYKNSNVYNMVTPRQPVLYKKFRELLEDKFQVYTRSVSDSTIDRKMLISEVQALSENYLKIMSNFLGEGVEQNTLDPLGIINISRLHPEVVQEYDRMLPTPFTPATHGLLIFLKRTRDAYQQLKLKEKVS